MPKLTLTVETVTPLLMNGADQKPEIRAASFRGVFRYWLRAVLGGVYQNNIEALTRAESSYFGSTDAASPLRVSVKNIKTSGISSKRVLPPDFPFPSFDESTTGFQIILSTHPLCDPKSVFNRPLFAALLLAFHLGAFGKRSRRGGGILRVLDAIPDRTIKDDEDFEKFARFARFQADTSPNLIEFFNQDLIPFTNLSENYDNTNSRMSYPTWNGNHVKIRISGKGFLDNPKYDSDRKTPPFFEGYRIALQELWDISGKLKLHHGVDVWGFAGSDGRRASAVHFHLHKGTKGQFYPIVTMFRSGAGKWDRLEAFDEKLKESSYHLLTPFCQGVWS